MRMQTAHDRMARRCLVALLAMMTAASPAALFGCGSCGTSGGGGGAAAGSSFALAVTPGSNSVAAGQTATYTATLTTTNGFSSPVTLSASGLPAGATAAFSPTPVTPSTGGATSTLTVTTTAPPTTGDLNGTIRSARTRQSGTQTPPGTYTITVSATGGGATKTATVQLVVTAPSTAGDFVIDTFGTNPSASVSAGRSTGFDFQVEAVNGFSGPVALSMTGLPAGASVSLDIAGGSGPTATVNVDANTRASGTANIQTSASTPPGAYTLQIVGTSGGITHRAPLTLVVTSGGE